MALITPRHVADAHTAGATGQRDLIAQHFVEDMRWLVPGGDQLSGLMARVGERSENSFQMRNAEDYSADVTTTPGTRRAILAAFSTSMSFTGCSGATARRVARAARSSPTALRSTTLSGHRQP